LFPLFDSNGKNLVEAAQQLKLLMKTNDPVKQEEIASQISDLEKNSDIILKDTCARLNRLFILPFDREDISKLVNKTDDVLENMNSMARMVRFYKISGIYPVYNEMADIVYLASKEISSCLEYLKDINNHKSLINKSSANIRDLVKKADEIFYAGILNLFVEKEDAVSMTKKKDILDTYMKCMRDINSVSEIMRTIQIKVA
jgi:predicted phosphate transport protein (TIGR00153 family)